VPAGTNYQTSNHNRLSPEVFSTRNGNGNRVRHHRITFNYSVISKGELLAMTNFGRKLFAAGVVAALAVAMSVAPTEAAKKRMKTARGCTTGQLCSTGCNGTGCFMNYCTSDGKWERAILTPICAGSLCPKKC
jgi:hypothetical protein